MNNIDYKKIKAWPFQEAFKIKNKLSRIDNKKVVTFETGYGLLVIHILVLLQKCLELIWYLTA